MRLLLDSEGGFEITDEVLAQAGGEQRAGRVRIAAERTDPADRMLYHKTTHRPLYAQAFEKAAREGFDDVLFLNLRGEVAEGAISNVFVEKDGLLVHAAGGVRLAGGGVPPASSGNAAGDCGAGAVS